MSKKETTTIYTTLVGDQGAYANIQSSPRRQSRYNVWREKLREKDAYGKKNVT